MTTTAPKTRIYIRYFDHDGQDIRQGFRVVGNAIREAQALIENGCPSVTVYDRGYRDIVAGFTLELTI